MRLNPDPRLPREGANNFTTSLLLRLNQLFRDYAAQLNAMSEGRIEAKTNAMTAAPTSGKWAQGDVIWNSEPTEAGATSSKYVILGWVCTAGGEPGTWLPIRTLTGN